MPKNYNMPSNGDVIVSKPSRGASLVEYALLIALLSLVAIGAIKAFSAKAVSQFNMIESNI